MCVQQTAPKPAPSKPTARRFCRWVYDAQTTLRLLEDGIPAPLCVSTARGEWAYLVTLRSDGVYEMGHARSDDEGTEVYTVDPSRGTCTCPQYMHKFECKKHAPALKAALNWLEARR